MVFILDDAAVVVVVAAVAAAAAAAAAEAAAAAAAAAEVKDELTTKMDKKKIHSSGKDESCYDGKGMTYEGVCYYLRSEKVLNFEQSEAACLKDSAHLVYLTNENLGVVMKDYLQKEIKSNNKLSIYIWTGATYKGDSEVQFGDGSRQKYGKDAWRYLYPRADKHRQQIALSVWDEQMRDSSLFKGLMNTSKSMKFYPFCQRQL